MTNDQSVAINAGLRFGVSQPSRRQMTQSPRRSSGISGAVVAAALLATGSLIHLRAQPVPKINSLSPEWVQHGTSVDVTLSGENLTNVTALLFGADPDSNQRGVAATDLKSTDGKSITAKITVAADASPGEREVRAVSPTGISEPLVFSLSDLPEVNETGTNQSPETAQTFDLPAALNGRIKAPAEVDYYRFHAKKGDQLIFEVYGSRIGSPLDSSLALLNAEGKELARNEDANGLDSLIEFAVPDEADYLLQIRDFRYRGGADYRYRLHAGTLPYLDSIFPLGGRRGQSVEIALEGRNLGDAKTLTKKIDPSAPLGPTEIRARSGGHVSNARNFEIGDLPEFIEIEPNDTEERANTVPVPITINGRISDGKDIDVFKFKSEKDQRLLCEVHAQRLESPLDALLVLKDAQGKMLAQNDDAQGMDSQIEFDRFAKDQEYTLTLRDLNGRGGTSFSYRLSIHPIEPDFIVRFFPDIPRVNRGGHTKVRCEVTRLGDFRGPVRVAFEGLPPGVYSQPLVLTSETPGTGLLVLSASPEAALGNFPIKLTAASVVRGTPIAHAAEPIIPGQKPRPGKRSVRATEDRAVDDAFLTVLDEAPFTIDLLSLAAEADQDQTATIEVRVQRSKGFTNDIELTAEGYSTDREPISKNVDVPAVVLNGDQTRAKIKLNAKAGAEVGTRTIMVKGSTTNGPSNPQYTPTLPLTLKPIPFTLASSLPRLTVTALPPEVKSAAGEAVFSIKADRRQGFKGEITLTVEGLPDGIVSTFDRIGTNQSEATVKLTAATNAPVGKEVSFTFLGVGLFNDRNYKHRTAPIKLTVNAPEETVTSASK
jgi:hypothetical protein